MINILRGAFSGIVVSGMLFIFFPTPWIFVIVPLVVFGAHIQNKEKKEAGDRLLILQSAIEQWRDQRKKFRTRYPDKREWDEYFETGDNILLELKVYCAGLKAEPRKLYEATASRYFDEVSEEMEKVELSRISGFASAEAPKSPTIEELAKLRDTGLISGEEFNAFSQRFEKSSGEVAQEIIAAIEDLHRQYASGAISEGNYRASLWTLMDKLDREMIKRK